MNFNIEYLAIFQIKENFLESADSFKNLLMTHSLIKIDKNTLQFKDIKFEFGIHCHEIKDRNQRMFKIKTSTGNEYDIVILSDLLKIIREFIYKMDGKISIIWDDISNYYSVKSYPEINKIENLLRKLITFFMISNFGFEWTEENIPVEIKKNIKNPRDKNNFLHDTDFIQLADFLFKPYPNKHIEGLIKDLKNHSNSEKKDDKYFEQFIPKSNWERYFNNFVNCEDGYLLKKWTRLYELRCLIAHNSFINKMEFEEIHSIVKDLEEKFDNAILSLDNIIIPKEEKIAVIESVASARNELIESFLVKWDPIYDAVIELYKTNGFTNFADKPLKEIINDLISNEILSKEFLEDLNPIGILRNKMLHLEEKISDEEILDATNSAIEFYNKYIFLEAPFYF